ncbi:MAG TPA: hypothetical protein DCZ59_10960, partial [Bacteroidetes bacterium]|nr:hypothetical protein [Bacteroidota bacterium]
AEFYIVFRDSTRPSRCVFYVQDWADNITIDSVSYNPVGSIDTMPPLIRRVDTTVTSWTFQVTDERNIPPQPLPCPTVTPQIESGLQSIELLASAASRNIGLVRLDSLSKDSLRPTLRARFRCFVADPKSDAQGVFEVVDHRGNRSRDSVRYSAPTSIATEDAHRLRSWYDGSSLHVECPDDFPMWRVSITDLTGRVIATDVGTTPHRTIPMNLSCGVYLVVIQSEQTAVSASFVVWH